MTAPDAISEDRKREIDLILADIENESIDKSQWRSRKEPLVNEFRASKEDIVIEKACPDCAGAGAASGKRCPTCRGNKRVPDTQWQAGTNDIRYAQAQVRNILNYLREARDADKRPILTDQNVHDGETFEIWQMWFTAELSCRPSTIYSNDMRGIRRALNEDDLAHDDYGKLIRGLSKEHIRLIETAIKAPATEHNCWLAMRSAEKYREAFDRLGVVMDRLREEYKERQESGN